MLSFQDLTPGPSACFRSLDVQSIPAPSCSRPEPRTASYISTEHAYTHSCQIEQLRRCLPAALKLQKHEEDLKRTGVINGANNPLPSLEKRLLDLASSGACLGICFGTFYRHEDFSFARLIQYGCLQRVFSSEGVRNSLENMLSAPQPFLTYNIFSQKDLLEGSRKRKKCDRLPRVYKANVEHVEKLLRRLETATSDGITCLRGGVMMLLKKNSKANETQNRFYFTFGCMNARPEMSQQLEVLLNQHQTSGVHQLTETLLEDLGPAPGIQEQLDAIGSLDHHTENIVRFDGAGTLCKKTGSYYPTCFVTCAKLSSNKLTPHFFRIRLLHFLLKGDLKQVMSLLDEKSSVPERPHVEPSMFQGDQPAECAPRKASRGRRIGSYGTMSFRWKVHSPSHVKQSIADPSEVTCRVRRCLIGVSSTATSDLNGATQGLWYTEHDNTATTVIQIVPSASNIYGGTHTAEQDNTNAAVLHIVPSPLHTYEDTQDLCASEQNNTAATVIQSDVQAPQGSSKGGTQGQALDQRNKTSLMLKRLQKSKKSPHTSITGNQSALYKQFLKSQIELKESMKELNKRKTKMFKCKAAYIAQKTKKIKLEIEILEKSQRVQNDSLLF